MAKFGYEVTRTVRYYPFLWSASARALEQAKAMDDPRHFCVMAIISAAFCLEAFLNEALAKKFHHWKGLERLSPQAKLDLLLDVTKYSPDMGSRPFQSFSRILTFRNHMAHPKPFTQSYSGQTDGETLQDVVPPDPPQQDWEKMLSVQVVEVLVKDTMAMIDDLSDKVLREKVTDWAEEDRLWWISPPADATKQQSQE